MKAFIVILLLFIIGLTSGYVGYTLLKPQTYNFRTPIGQTQVQGISTQSDHIVYGFLPYWLIKHTQDFKYDTLSHMAYFGVAIDEQGNIQTNLEDGSKELGLHRIDNPQVTYAVDQTLQTGGSPILVIRVMSTEAITAATSPENQPQLIDQIIKLAKQHQYKGLNIDFEPTGNETPVLKDRVTDFTKQLNSSCKQQIPGCHISIDVYPSVGTKPRIWDLTELSKHIDHLIIMGYDFYRTSSPQAGPNAPIHGAPDLWKYDLNDTTNAIMAKVPPQKIILAVPYYGYQWTTQTSTPGSTAIGRGSLATYTRTQILLQECKENTTCKITFDSQSLSPVMTFNQNNTWQQVWFENTQSLKIKYLYIKSIPLAGVAIWALGYDAPHPELWQLLDQEFRPTTNSIN